MTEKLHTRSNGVVAPLLAVALQALAPAWRVDAQPVPADVGAALPGITTAVAAPPTGISGSVTDSVTGDALAGIEVRLEVVLYGERVATTTSGTDGSYSFTGITPGTYQLRTFNRAGYLDEGYDNIRCTQLDSCAGAGTPVAVVAGAMTTANFALTPGARFAGRVLDATTLAPIPGVQVAVRTGTFGFLSFGVTGSDGSYLTGQGFPTGSYYLTTSDTHAYIPEAYENSVCLGICSLSSAVPAPAVNGATTGGVDFFLAEGSQVGGNVIDASSGQPLRTIYIWIYDQTGRHVGRGVTDASGAYLSEVALPDGTYYARSYNDQGYVDRVFGGGVCTGPSEGSCAVTAGTPIEIAGATVGGIDFALTQGGRISGTVTNAATGLPLASVQVAIYNSSGFHVMNVYTNGSGVYTSSAGLLSGTYYAGTLNFSGYIDELYNDISCPGGSCTVTNGTPILVTVGTTTGIDFGLTLGGRISGRVTDVATGLPLPSVSVWVYSSGGARVTDGRTDGSGVYTSYSGLPSGMYYARTSNALGYVDELHNDISCPCSVAGGTPISVAVGTTTTGIDFGLATGGRISGRVTDVATGMPLANVSVSVYNSGGARVTYGWTDGSGAYTSYSGLPSGTYYARTWNSLGYVDELYNDISCPSGSCTVTAGTPVSVTVGTTTTGIDSGLAAGGRISGTVTDVGTGLPLANASVSVYNSSGSFVTYAHSDSSGVYWSGLPPGTYYARTSNTLGYVDELYNDISCPGSSCTVTSGAPISVTVGTTTAGIDFGLAAGGRISGTVTDTATGVPLANVQVSIYNSSGSAVASGSTNSFGAYTSNSGLPSGTYYARTRNWLGYIEELYNDVSCPGSSCTVTTGTPISVTVGTTTTGIDFGLAAGGRISGAVTDAATGLALASEVYIHDSSGSYVTSEYTNAFGGYTTSTGLPSGTYYARTRNWLGYIEELYNDVSCPGISCTVTAGTPISVTLGTTTTGIDFGLATGGRISGRVTDVATGLPLAGVGVWIQISSGSYVRHEYTDGSGAYTSYSGLPSGTYYVRTSNTLGYVDELYNDISCPSSSCTVTSGAPISVTVGTTTTGIDFGLAAGGRISGTVTDAGTGMPLARVGVYFYNSSGGLVGSAYTDGAGVYTTFAGLPSGTYYAVTSNSQGYVDELYGNIVCPGYACALTSGTTVPVTVGGTTSGIDFALAPGGRISGTVTDASSGLPLGSVTVEIRNANGILVGSGSTDSLGTFATRSGLPTGTYYAKTTNSRGYVDELYDNLPCPGYGCSVTGGVPISVTAATTTGSINFALESGGRIGGQVTDATSGLPIWGVSVHALNAAGDQLASASTTYDGRYSMGPGLPTGSYYLLTTNSAGYLDELHSDVVCPSHLMLKEGIGLSGRRVPVASCSVSSGATVPVTAGATTSVDLALALGGRVSGLVTGAGGGVLQGARIDVFDATGQRLGAGETDVNGFYHTPAVPAGSYYLRTSNSSGWADELFDDISCPNGSCSVTSGTAVGVSVGATASGISFELTPQADVSITKTDGATTEVSGTPVTYAIVATNAGPSNAPSVTVVDTFPGTCTGATWTCAGAGGGTCAPSGSGDINDVADLPVGGSVTYVATCTISASATGSLSNTATASVGAGVTDPTPGNNSATDTDTLTAAHISGEVTDATTGLPLANVRVRVYNASGTQVTSVNTSSSGVYATSTGLSPGTYYARTQNSLGYVDELYNDTSCPGGVCTVTAGTPISVTAGSTTTGIDFGLLSGGRVSGRVTDVATGLPLANVQVRVYNAGGTRVTSVNTNSSGVYATSTGLSAGTYYARTSNTLGYIEELYNDISCPGGVCTVTTGAPISVTAGSTTTGIDFGLLSGGRISGTVTDVAGGVPLANVQVRVHNASGAQVTSVNTNSSGVYTTAGLPAGTYYARTSNTLGYIEELYNDISCPGGVCTVTAGTPITLTAGSTTTGIDFGLLSGGRISGAVTEVAVGLPLANVRVRVYNSSGTQVTSVNTNSSGVYTTAGLPAGTYYARTSNTLGYVEELYNDISCPGGICTVTTGALITVTVGTTTAGIDFGLAQGGRIGGTVTDAATGLPLANVQVRVHNSSGTRVGSVNTDSSGVYATSGLPAGTYYARTWNSLGYVEELYNDISCPGGVCTVTAGTPITVTVGTTTAGIDFGLAQGGRIGGTVTDAATGLPLANVQVRVHNSSGTRVGSVSTDSSGVYMTSSLPLGTYYARTWNSLGYVEELYNDILCPGGVCTVTAGTPITVTVGTTTTGIDFGLAQGGRIGGTVTDAATGLPLANVQVRVHNSSGTRVGSVSTDSSGVYMTSSLPLGTYYARTWNSLGYVEELYNDILCPGGVCTVTAGTPITVTVGTTTTGIDFGLAQSGP